MRRYLANPFILFLLFLLLLLGFAGGPLGAAFLGMEKPTGFLGAPMPHIELPGETLLKIKENPLKILNFFLTNTMLTALLVSLFLLFISWRATRKLSLVPKGLQNLIETVIEFFLDLVSKVAGREHSRRIFPLIITIFLFILLANWMGIFPFIGSIGLVKAGYEEAFKQLNIGGFKLFYVSLGAEKAELKGYIPLIRPATTDINIPLAMAIIGMVMVQYWGIRASGLLGYLSRFIILRNLLRGRLFTGVVDLGVGSLEALSQLAQVISLTFRLFGNIFAGDVLIIIMSFLFPLVWILPIYGLEIIIGLVQAFIFAMLILVFATLAVAGHESTHKKEEV